MHRFDFRDYLVASASVVALCIASSAAADGSGWFSSAQVQSGRLEFAAKCETCHGAQLQGTGAPALKGRPFNLQWSGVLAQALVNGLIGVIAFLVVEQGPGMLDRRRMRRASLSKRRF